MCPSTCLLLWSPVLHPLPWSLDSSAIGLVFVSKIRQASSCFRVIAFAVNLWLENSSSKYSYAWLLLISHVSEDSLSHLRQVLLCVSVFYSFSLSEMFTLVLVYLLISVSSYYNISSMRAGICIVCSNILYIQKRFCRILGIQ